MSTVINIITTILLLPWGAIVMMSPMMVASPGFKDSLPSILTAILFIGYPVIVFAVHKLLGYRFYGMSVNGWLIGFFVVTGGIILLYGLPGMLLNLKRGIPNSGYFKNETTVYLEGRRIHEANAGSFEVMEADSRYARDKAFVFYNGKTVDGADPDTFEPVEIPEKQSFGHQSPAFWKDDTHVYFNGSVVEDSDAKSFRYITGHYGKDLNHVYYETGIIEQADPSEFRFLSAGIAIDGSSTFIHSKRSKMPVDLGSFEVVENDNGVFCKDKNGVYILFYGQKDPLVKVEGSDPATFTLLERSYAKDDKHVFYYGYSRENIQKLILLEGANPETFTVGYDKETGSEARDGARCYMYGELVKK